MAKCKCGTRSRIVSSAVNSMKNCNCKDVCVNPICGDPNSLSMMTPLIYDEIGINLCTTLTIDPNIATTYPTATHASVQAINATYTYGADNVQVEAINGRPNCYVITLTNITVQFALRLYDEANRLVTTLYPTATYLPSDTTSAFYDEDTNPSSVELELFAPYGLSYEVATGATAPTPVINYIGFVTPNNTVRQGVNLYSYAKLLNLDTTDSTITVGLTLVLQSLYYAGYKVKSEGKIETPKGSIINPDNSDCMRFVAGDLLNLAIKPLDLSCPYTEELKKPCPEPGSECSVIVEDNAASANVTPPTPPGQ